MGHILSGFVSMKIWPVVVWNTEIPTGNATYTSSNRSPLRYYWRCRPGSSTTRKSWCNSTEECLQSQPSTVIGCDSSWPTLTCSTHWCAFPATGRDWCTEHSSCREKSNQTLKLKIPKLRIICPVGPDLQDGQVWGPHDRQRFWRRYRRF